MPLIKIMLRRISLRLGRWAARPYLLCLSPFRSIPTASRKPEPARNWLSTLNGPSGPRRFADAGFEPGGQIFEMNAPAAVDGGVVVIPVLTFADARVYEMEACAIVFRCQFKGDRGGARLKGFPAIAQAMGRLT